MQQLFVTLMAIIRAFGCSFEEKWPALASRKEALFHRDIARPLLTANVPSVKIEELSWKNPTPALFPDLTPTDYHLLRCIRNHSHGLVLKSPKEIVTHVSSFSSENFS